MNHETKMAYPTTDPREKLISKAIYHIVQDAVKYGDYEAASELLNNLTNDTLLNFLNEDEQDWTAFCSVSFENFEEETHFNFQFNDIKSRKRCYVGGIHFSKSEQSCLINLANGSKDALYHRNQQIFEKFIEEKFLEYKFSEIVEKL